MKKIISICLIVVLVLNLILFGMHVIDLWVFWVVIAVIGFVAYKVLPSLGRKQGVSKK